MGDVVNGTAHDLAALGLDAGLLSQNSLSVDGSHAQEGDDPHPEDSTGAAGQDSTGSTDDVAGTDLSCNSSGQSLERGHTAFMLLAVQSQLAEHIAHTFAEAAHLNELGLEGEPQAGAHQQEHQNVVRQVGVQSLNHGKNSGV